MSNPGQRCEVIYAKTQCRNLVPTDVIIGTLVRTVLELHDEPLTGTLIAETHSRTSPFSDTRALKKMFLERYAAVWCI